jgi:crotonobetainyl-CoA:carnitine CoA-transferase CaiB-like acyl-CoA transferase
MGPQMNVEPVPDDPVSAPAALDGIVVADFSRIVAGPVAAMLLGDLGAEVIKVESPAGDDTRTFTPPMRDGISTYYMSVNRNKRSIALDLAEPADLEVAHALSARADVVVHNFKPGGIERYGLGYEQVVARRPDTVYCAISGYGTKGGAGLPGYDLLIQAASGLMSMTGEADGPPMRAGMSVFDAMTGLHATIGILAALRHRDRTGQGQLIELDLLSSAMFSMLNQTSAYVAGGVVPTRMGNQHPSLYPYEPLPTADGEIVVAAGNDRQYAALCRALGVAALAADPRFATLHLRNQNRDVLRPLLIEALASRTAREWFAVISAAGLPCAPINDVRGGIELAGQLGLEPVADVGGTPMVRNPLRMSLTPPTHRLPPPALDDGGTEIRRWLGFEPVVPVATGS